MAPIPTTIEPVATTMAPVKTTMAPVKTTMAPVMTTMAPVMTTMAPVKTTMAPATDEKPAVTTSNIYQFTYYKKNVKYIYLDKKNDEINEIPVNEYIIFISKRISFSSVQVYFLNSKSGRHVRN